MRRSWVAGLLGVVVLLVGSSAFIKQARTGGRLPPQASPRAERAVPEHAAYNFLFRSIVSFKKQAAAAGRPQAHSRSLQEEGALTAAQLAALEEIAAATIHEVEQQDARAQAVIKAVRARYPNGVIPRGEKLPEPPPELKVMQEERDAMLLRGRDRVRAALGEQKFAHFNEFTLRRFAGKGLTK